MRTALALLAGLWAAPAAAVEPAAPCLWHAPSQTIHGWNSDVSYDETADIYPQPLPNGFVWSHVVLEDAGLIVLHHCPSDAWLIAASDLTRDNGVLARFEEMMAGEEGYALAAIATELRGLGAFSRQGEGAIGRCDCDTAS